VVKCTNSANPCPSDAKTTKVCPKDGDVYTTMLKDPNCKKTKEGYAADPCVYKCCKSTQEVTPTICTDPTVSDLVHVISVPSCRMDRHGCCVTVNPFPIG